MNCLIKETQKDFLLWKQLLVADLDVPSRELYISKNTGALTLHGESEQQKGTTGSVEHRVMSGDQPVPDWHQNVADKRNCSKGLPVWNTPLWIPLCSWRTKTSGIKYHQADINYPPVLLDAEATSISLVCEPDTVPCQTTTEAHLVYTSSSHLLCCVSLALPG